MCVNCDAIAIQETKLNSDFYDGELQLKGYDIHRLDRNSHGGGVLIAIKSEFKATRVNIQGMAEMVVVRFSTKTRNIYFGSYYRPNCKDNDSTEGLVLAMRSIVTLWRADRDIVFLGGDFNMPDVTWLHGIPASKGDTVMTNQSSLVLSELQQFEIEQMVDVPTRGNNFLDLFFTNLPACIESVVTSGPLSDHLGVCVRTNIYERTPTGAKPKVVKQWDKCNLSAVSEVFQNLLTKLTDVVDVDQQWSHFKEAAIECIGEHVPDKEIKNVSGKKLDRELRKLYKLKQRAYTRKVKYPSVGNTQQYKYLCSAVKETKRREEQKSIARVCSKLNNRSALWSHLRHIRENNPGIRAVETQQGVLLTDAQCIADELARSFASVFTKESDLNHIDGREDDEWLPRMISYDITVSGIFKQLSELKVKKATGLDGIPNAFLRVAAAQLAPALTVVYNTSLQQSKLPTDWKEAIVHPIFKKGSRIVPLNYRPISLTSNCCKVMEHVIASQLNNFLDSHDITYERQHGFRSRHSCETALASFTHQVELGLRNGNEVDCLFLDFQKAFDTVPHKRLISKLTGIGVDTITVSWIADFLKNRTFVVRVDGKFSLQTAATSGVPQGSVLGPILFKIFINDLPIGIRSKMTLFADDVLLYREISGTNDIQIMKRDIASIETWSRESLLRFNPKKCSYMRFAKPHSQNRTAPTTYVLYGESISQTHKETYLGITIESSGRWDANTLRTISKANAVTGVLKRNFSAAPQESKLLLYKTMVRPILDYCSAICEPTTKESARCLEMAQRKACRFIKSDYGWRSSVTEMRESLQLEELVLRRTQKRRLLVGNILEGKIEVPDLDIGRSVSGRMHINPPLRKHLKRRQFGIFYETVNEINNEVNENIGKMTNEIVVTGSTIPGDRPTILMISYD
jgi:hypothetical protein